MPPFTVKMLGRKGRFANQLLQYAHLRQRAQENPDGYCCPAWVGQSLFGLKDPPMVKGAQDIGFKFPLKAGFYDPKLFRSLFQPQPNYQERVIEKLHDGGRTVLGLHLRRGDYGTFRRKSARWTFVAPTVWYLEWLEQNWDRFYQPVLFLASDEPDAVRGDFKHYPMFLEPWQPEEAPFYPDFRTLTQCDVLLTSNSTFSFVASMLNERAKEFWRPRLSEKCLVHYEPWSSPLVLTNERYD